MSISSISLQATIALFASAISLNCSALTPPEIYHQTQQRVVVLELLDNSGQAYSPKTALLIGSDKAVTQCDLLSKASGLRLVQGGVAFQAKLDKKDSSRNLCLLSVPGANFQLSGIVQDKEPVVGSKVYAIGNALGLGLSISEGLVAGIRESQGESYIQFTAAIAPGSEGGGLFDVNGNLIGVISYRQLDGQNVNFAFPAHWIAQVEQRSDSNDANGDFREQAAVMQSKSDWQGLAQHALKWTQVSPGSLEAWLWLGNAQEQLKNWDAAEHAYREGLKRDPASISTNLGLGRALIMQKKPQEALDIARAQLAYRKEYSPTWLVIAFAEFHLRHLDEARFAFERAAQFDPLNKDPYFGLAALARVRQDGPSLLAAQRQLIRMDPKSVTGWTMLADAYLMAGRGARALTSAEHALELAPDSGDALLLKGVALMQLKRYTEAIGTLKKSLEYKPLKPEFAWDGLGDIYYNKLQLYPEAIAAYREATRLAPSNVSYKASLALALKDGLYLDEALALFRELKAANPGDPFPSRQIGYVYGYQSDSEAAIPALEESLRLDPKQAKVWLNMARVYRMSGRDDDVRRAYQKLTDLDPVLAKQAYRSYILPFEGTP